MSLKLLILIFLLFTIPIYVTAQYPNVDGQVVRTEADTIFYSQPDFNFQITGLSAPASCPNSHGMEVIYDVADYIYAEDVPISYRKIYIQGSIRS